MLKAEYENNTGQHRIHIKTGDAVIPVGDTIRSVREQHLGSENSYKNK